LSPGHHLERWAGSNHEQVAGVFEHQPKPPIESEAIEIADAPRGGPNARARRSCASCQRTLPRRGIHVVTSHRGVADWVRSAIVFVELAEKFRRQLEAV
jgi:hypothetical protein